MVGRPTACTLHHLTYQEKMFALPLLLVVLLLVSILLVVESCIPFKMPELKKHEGFSRIGMDSYQQLQKEIKSSVKSATRKRTLKSCFRLNLTSDLPWENMIVSKFPVLQFYDYTKHLKRFVRFLEGKLPSNYHLTYSRSEETPDTLVKSLCASGGNVAVVFRNHLPDKWLGLEVIDGDDSDLRFEDGNGKIVGLLEKGLAKKDKTGFVVEPE